jgi:hypothetical protein
MIKVKRINRSVVEEVIVNVVGSVIKFVEGYAINAYRVVNAMQ